MMISNLLSQQKFVLFIDNVGLEKYSEHIITKILSQQGKDNLFKLPTINYTFDSALQVLRDDEILNIPPNAIVLLQPLSKMLTRYRIKTIFQFIHKIKTNSNIKQIFLWATAKNISDQFVIPFIEHLSDQIVSLHDLKNLSLVTKKSGGIVTNKSFQYKFEDDNFIVEETKRIKEKPSEPEVKHETTFKLELEEDELIARNAVKLPYERSIEESQQGKIMYAPEANDDFDEDDPDDDLCI